MYPVSAAYLIAIAKNARAHKVSGSVGGHVFDGDDVIRGTFTVKNQFCPATKIALGGVYIGEMDLTFTTAFAESLNNRGSWRGTTISAELGVELADSSFEYVPCPGGTYTIADAQWCDEGLKIVAYDNMSKFDVPIQITQSSGTLYDWLNYICLVCGVTLGMSLAECDAMPNGLLVTSPYVDSPISTYRDLLSYLAVSVGCFATIDRNGALVLRKLPNYNDVVLTVTAKQRYSTTFADYTSYYSSIEVENIADNTYDTYINTNVGGLCMELGGNPFMQYGTDVFIQTQRQAIADALVNFRAVPFKASLLPNPALDLGDLLQFSGGIGNNSLGCIMSFSMRVDSLTIEGYGENPTAADAQTANDKAIASQAKNQKDALIYNSFANTSVITIDDGAPTKIVEIEFGTNDDTSVLIEQEFKTLNEFTGSDQMVTYLYYLDDELVTYSPIDTWGEQGYHTQSHPYLLLDVPGGSVHTWTVYAYTSEGTATIDVNDAHTWLIGQGLIASGGFNGAIEVSDEFTPIEPNNEIVSPIGESVNVEFEGSGTDRLVTEDLLNYIVTEDGNNYIVEE